MSGPVAAAVGFAVGAGASTAFTPLAIRAARKTNFYDRPRGYHRHKVPTPFLGGAAVLAAVLLAGAISRGASGHLPVVLGCAVGMWLLGTLDDRIAVAPKWRVLASAGAASALYGVGLGWDTAGPGIIDLGLTMLWVVGLVNAVNLMDNLDGACGTVACVAAVGIGVLAAIRGDVAVAGLSFALAGACAGFLPWNLAGPAKVFLGDGGSMPVGFLLAALAMVVARKSSEGNAGLLLGALLVGLPIFDVTLVSVSRTRRGVSLMTGGRDHLTHRLLLAFHTPRRVALAVGVLQCCLSVLAVVGFEAGTVAVAVFAFIAFVVGVVAILVLDSAAWRPAGIAMGRTSEPVARAPQGSVGVDSG